MQMYFADSKELQEETPVAKSYPPMGIELRFSDIHVLSDTV